jgi:hypothetical protein
MSRSTYYVYHLLALLPSCNVGTSNKNEFNRSVGQEKQTSGSHTQRYCVT